MQWRFLILALALGLPAVVANGPVVKQENSEALEQKVTKEILDEDGNQVGKVEAKEWTSPDGTSKGRVEQANKVVKDENGNVIGAQKVYQSSSSSVGGNLGEFNKNLLGRFRRPLGGFFDTGFGSFGFDHIDEMAKRIRSEMGGLGRFESLQDGWMPAIRENDEESSSDSEEALVVPADDENEKEERLVVTNDKAGDIVEHREQQDIVDNKGKKIGESTTVKKSGPGFYSTSSKMSWSTRDTQKSADEKVNVIG